MKTTKTVIKGYYKMGEDKMNNSKVKYRLRTEHLEKNGIGKSKLAEMTGASELTVNRWYLGYKIPSLENLINLAWCSNTNVSYLLNACEVNRPLHRKEPHLRLSQLRKELNYSITALCEATGLNHNTIKDCERNESFAPDKKMPTQTTLFKVAESLGVSLDFLLGLSDYRTWDEQERHSPFLKYPPGLAIHIKAGDYETDCLIDVTGENVIFPTGEAIGIDSEKLAFATVYDIREEAKRRRSGDVL